MSEKKRAHASRKKQVREGDYVKVTSEVEQPLLKPGATSKHNVTFEFLTPLELELAYEVRCPAKGALRYPVNGSNGNWKDTPWEGTHLFGGFNPDLRVADFTNEVEANPDFASTDNPKNQRLSLKTKARFGAGQWESDVSLDHPIVITE